MVAGEFYNKQYDKLTNIFTLLLYFIILCANLTKLLNCFINFAPVYEKNRKPHTDFSINNQ